MRRSCALGLLALLPALGGCDSEQPAQAGARTMSVDFAATNLAVVSYNVWDLYFDDDGDGQPDRFCDRVFRGAPCASDSDCPLDQVCDFPLFCELVIDAATGQPVISTVNGPWQFSVAISVIPEGETTRKPVTSSAAASSATANLTPYDTFEGRGRTCPVTPTFPCPDPSGQFEHANPRRLSEAHRLILDNSGINGTCGTDANLGDPSIDGRFPFILNVNRGDTVLVEARKSDSPPPGFQAQSDPTLAGRMLLDGQTITPVGSTTSTAAPGAGVAFSFTVR